VRRGWWRGLDSVLGGGRQKPSRTA
jgi:hypothetical protein